MIGMKPKMGQFGSATRPMGQGYGYRAAIHGAQNPMEKQKAQAAYQQFKASQGTPIRTMQAPPSTMGAEQFRQLPRYNMESSLPGNEYRNPMLTQRAGASPGLSSMYRGGQSGMAPAMQSSPEMDSLVKALLASRFGGAF